MIRDDEVGAWGISFCVLGGGRHVRFWRLASWGILLVGGVDCAGKDEDELRAGCIDAIDNDEDGTIDCADPSCAAEPACASVDETDTGSPTDSVGPTIVYDPLSVVSYGASVPIVATISDASGVFGARVWYRRETAVSWSSSELAGAADRWSGEIPGSAVGSGGMDYYLEAEDTVGNTGAAPAEGAGQPYHATVTL